MKIFGLTITRTKKAKTFWTHVAFTSNKRGKKSLFINGIENKEKEFTVDFWINNEDFAKLDKSMYRTIKER